MGRAMMYIASVFSQLERETIAQQAEALAELEAAGTAAQVDAQLRAAYQEGVEQNG